MIPRNFAPVLRKSLRLRTPLPLISNWVCRGCRANSTAAPPEHRLTEKPYYVTTPIFYVNADPHVGHMYTMILADVLKRWQVLKGENAILCTGTDEHGLKVQQAAANADTPPREFCNKGAKTFKLLAETIDMSNDHFVRTTDEDHKEAVQYFWYMLQERGFIYKTKHEGWYCVSDETFYPESTIEKRLDPATGRTFLASKETGKEVEWTSESNYHFRLSSMRSRLLEFYADNPEFIVPASEMRNVIKWVSDGLEDLSISRPVERLSWGIRVPGDDSQTIYVWLDALVNYITKAGYPWAPEKKMAGGWPADVQVIGKDIVRFHCIYWPAFLLALDLKPPKQILVHGHWTLALKKMAKSTGNVVNPFFAIERFGIDTMRWYLIHDGKDIRDSNYSNEQIVERYNKGLRSAIGNILARISTTRLWSLKDCIMSRAEIESNPSSAAETSEFVKLLEELPRQVDNAMKELEPRKGLHQIMEVLYNIPQLE
ncbi:methionyl-tRNA synthetase [Phlyctema vagabunda]|uniref:Methionyl-tRNA synthetase n=1 Tax=Phlyctema vagabunda TaxID=108571 RepID=A0ABR4PY55_9HELO